MEKTDILLSQWQTCVEMANSVSERRDTMNNLFVTVNLAIIAAISIMWDVKTIVLAIAGIVVCVIWAFFIRNFKLLNAAKFDVINSIEKNLPVSAFNLEWEILNSNKKYKEGTKLERFFPIAFCFLYFVMLIILIKTNNGGPAT